MPLPAAPKNKGSILEDIPEQLEPTPVRKKPVNRKPARKAAAATADSVATVPEKSPAEAVKAPAKASTPATMPVPAKSKPAGKIRSRKFDTHKGTILYVLDTNVLLHDPTCIFRFKEHDVYLPMITLEELDNHKSGMTDVARNARQVSRTLDAVIQHLEGTIADGIPLNVLGNKDCLGKLYIQTKPFTGTLAMLPEGKADNQILNVVKGLKDADPEQVVVLVSKDINMRLKATALNLDAEDYFNDKMIEDTDILYTGARHLPAEFWEIYGKDLKSWTKDGSTYYKVTGNLPSKFLVNEYVWIENDGTNFYGQVKAVEGESATIKLVKDYMNPKNSVWGITARNREQMFALDLLMNPDIDFVSLLGQAGTGKTLLALAAALVQTMDHRKYTEIIVTRATISVGEDIGFLPGTEEEKMTPWLGAIDDNIEVLNQGGAGNDWSRRASNDLIRSRIRIKSMSFMRGRTFLNKFVIIDEAQNLTPKQMKTLITRAGPGTKIVCLGNIAQIDTPYLTEGSSGLTYVVDRFKGWSHSGHVTMQRGERSRLADYATEAL